jgi:hypothetical protein
MNRKHVIIAGAGIGFALGILLVAGACGLFEMVTPLAILPAVRADWRSWETRKECADDATAFLEAFGFHDGPAEWLYEPALPMPLTAPVLPAVEPHTADVIYLSSVMAPSYRALEAQMRRAAAR